MITNNYFLKASLLINIILAGVFIWSLNTEFNSAPTIDRKSEIVNRKSVCDVVVNDSARNNIEVFSGISKKIDFESFPEVKLYRTAINREVEEGANFAGHYRFATWGCGTDCQGFAIVDLITGKIIEYQPVYPFASATGFSSSVTSNIVVFNPRPEQEKETQTIDELVLSEGNATKGRIYYQMTDSGYFRTLCIENFYAR